MEEIKFTLIAFCLIYLSSLFIYIRRWYKANQVKRTFINDTASWLSIIMIIFLQRIIPQTPLQNYISSVEVAMLQFSLEVIIIAALALSPLFLFLLMKRYFPREKA